MRARGIPMPTRECVVAFELKSFEQDGFPVHRLTYLRLLEALDVRIGVKDVGAFKYAVAFAFGDLDDNTSSNEFVYGGSCALEAAIKVGSSTCSGKNRDAGEGLHKQSGC